MENLLIRPARIDDTTAALEISATVWDGQDYVPRVWDSWLAEGDHVGFLMAAELNGKLIAFQHASIQSGGVAWFEGIRVHTEFRNRGVGHEMLRRGLELARNRRCTIARLSTVEVNTASNSIAAANGFEPVGTFYIFSAPASDAEGTRLTSKAVNIADLQKLRQRQNDPSTLVADGWTAYDLPNQRLPEDFGIHLCLETDGVVEGIALASESWDRNRITIASIVGTADAIRTLGQALRSEAHTRGLESATGMLRRSSNLDAGLSAAGYDMNRELVVQVLERPL